MQIGGFQSFTLSDYPGIPASIIFTQGCNMNCLYCHNHELIPHGCGTYTEEQIFSFLHKRKNRIKGVVVTGGEPTIHKDLPQFIGHIKEMGFDVKLDTNGTNPSMLLKLISNNMANFIAMDIKAPLNNKYGIIVDSSVNINNIKKSISIIEDSGINYIFRTTKVNSLISDQDIIEIKSNLKNIDNYIVQKYNPEFSRCQLPTG